MVDPRISKSSVAQKQGCACVLLNAVPVENAQNCGELKSYNQSYLIKSVIKHVQKSSTYVMDFSQVK